jgi:hypothetical protein
MKDKFFMFIYETETMDKKVMPCLCKLPMRTL